MKLIITNPRAGARELQLTNSASIGRSNDNTIQIDEPSVARYHAMIELRGNGFWLNDLGSTNGTILNGVRLAGEQQLKPGDTISLGSNTAIRVVAPEARSQPAANAGSPAANPAPVQQEAAATVAPAPTESSVSSAHIAIAGVMVVLVLGFVGIAVWIIRSKSSDHTAQNGPPTYYSPTPAATKKAIGSEITAPTPEPTKSVVVSQNVATGIEGLVGRLAGQLSGKGNYLFDPEMIARIAARTNDYRVDVTPLAQPYKLEVQRAFSSAKGLNPLYGHILAMSQSKYGQSSGSGIGIWQIPPAIAKDYVSGGTDVSTLNTPKSAADLAASHWQELSTTFDPQDFMYALACFGQTKSRAGELNQKLQSIDPNDRRNFWKQVKAGIVPPDGAEKVIRFFAAGIVGEYPASFGLTNATAFSEL